MKKLLLIAILAVICIDASAQQQSETTADGIRTATIGDGGVRLRRRDRILVRLGHELRFGVGAYGVGYVILGYTGCYDGAPMFRGGYSLQDFEFSKIYADAEYYTGVYSLNYSYRFNRTVSFGAALSYAGVTRRYRSIADDSSAGGDNRHFFSVMPLLRLYWLNSRYVSLYSSVGLGVTVERDVEKFGNRRLVHNEILFAGQFSPFGITVGKRLYGFAEFGVGTQGVIIGGIGYRF